MGHSLFEAASGLLRMALETISVVFTQEVLAVGLLGWVQGEGEPWGGGGR